MLEEPLNQPGELDRENGCWNCDYYEHKTGHKGECLRFPPVCQPPQVKARFPQVTDDTWCGEWFHERCDNPECLVCASANDEE